MNHVGTIHSGPICPGMRFSHAPSGDWQCCLRLSSGLEGSENDMIVAAINRTAWHSLGRRVGAIVVEVHKTHSQGDVRLRNADPVIAPEVKFQNLLR